MKKWIGLALVFLFHGAMELNALSFGGAAGADMPLVHPNHYETGVSAEGFYRIDPYEIRFHYGNTKTSTYSVVGAVKYFFSADIARPFVEAALGPVIVNTSGKGMAYGARPEASLGLDLGINKNLSTGAVFRYYGMAYFGDTASGKFEANHGFSLLGTFLVWF